MSSTMNFLEHCLTEMNRMPSTLIVISSHKPRKGVYSESQFGKHGQIHLDSFFHFVGGVVRGCHLTKSQISEMRREISYIHDYLNQWLLSMKQHIHTPFCLQKRKRKRKN